MKIVADLYVAINQGPVPPMIENARSGFLWDLFMNAPEMKIAAEKLGFKLKKINEVRI